MNEGVLGVGEGGKNFEWRRGNGVEEVRGECVEEGMVG